MEEIYFYSHGTSKQFCYMSNFYKCNFIDETGLIFNCSEQYFMYYKCKIFNADNNELLYKILLETDPSKIKKYGRQVKNFNESVWAQLKYMVMISALRLKFSQNFDIRHALLNTGNKMLYEASKNDKIWGIGFCEKDAIITDKSKFGQNLLGLALMQIRNEIGVI
jgi:ribA/ribD-fused uncharacterized protein